MNDFIAVHSWFEQTFKDKLGTRYDTMKIALNLYQQKPGKIIVETGTTRMPGDWGAGSSTIVFGQYLYRYGGKLITVDISPENITCAKSLTCLFDKFIEYHVSDSLAFLKNYTGKIDLLYLDSFDYPLGELLDIYNGKENLQAAMKTLKGMSTKELLARHEDIILPSQSHQLQELLAAEKHMGKGGIILLDDCDLPGGGKGRLTKNYLELSGATCILDDYQSLWLL